LLVENQEVDMCISLTSPSPETNEFSDFSVPVLFDETSIVIPFPQMKNFLLRLVDPFQNEVIYTYGIKQTNDQILHLSSVFSGLVGHTGFINRCNLFPLVH